MAGALPHLAGPGQVRGFHAGGVQLVGVVGRPDRVGEGAVEAPGTFVVDGQVGRQRTCQVRPVGGAGLQRLRVGGVHRRTLLGRQRAKEDLSQQRVAKPAGLPAT